MNLPTSCVKFKEYHKRMYLYKSYINNKTLLHIKEDNVQLCVCTLSKYNVHLDWIYCIR